MKAVILAGVVMYMTTPKPGKLAYLEIGLLLWLALIAELGSFLAVYIFHSNPNVYGNIFTSLSLPLLVLFYRRQVKWKNKNLIAGITIFLFIVINLTSFLDRGLFDFNSYTEAFASLCLIVISITYFYILIQELPTESITKLPIFWINSAVLINYSGSFIISLSSHYLITVLKDDMINSWAVVVFLWLIFYSFICYTMLLIRSEYLKRSE